MLTTKDEKNGFVYVLGSRTLFKYDGDYFDWLYLAMRWLPNMRKQDVFVLQDHWVMRDFVSFLEGVLFDFTPSIIWVPVRYLLDDAIKECPNVLEQLQSLANSGKVFVPYDGTTLEFRSWFNTLDGANLLGEDVKWSEQYATKAWLHPWASAPRVPSLAQQLNVPVLQGYNCENGFDLVSAWKLLNYKNVIIKPHRTAFGDGLVVLSDMSKDEVLTYFDNYRFPHGPVALEEYVHIDQDVHGEISWSTHYVGNKVFGPPTRQLITGVTSGGNITPAEYSLEVVQNLMAITTQVVAELGPLGFGGFNGPFVNGIPYLTDPNVGRITGVCPSILFRELYCPNAITLNKKLGKPKMSVQEAWIKLQSLGLSFDLARGYGVMIQGWIPSAWSQVICAADTESEVIQMYEHVKKVLVD